MSSAQKIWPGSSLNEFARRKALDAIQQTGRSLPCTVVSVVGAIVEVNFEINSPFTLPRVQVPIIGSEYIRLPIQSGCKGMVIAADARLGLMTGMGSGVADLTQPANLSALAFVPLGNAKWFSVSANATVIYGPNGVVLMDAEEQTTLTLTPSGCVISGQSSVQMAVGANSVTVTAAGVAIVGILTINGEPYLGHMHLASGGTGIGGPVAP